MKRISISIDDDIYEQFFATETYNRSAFIRKIIRAGTEALLDPDQTSKSRFLKVLQEKENLENENRKLKLSLDGFKARMNKKYSKYLDAHPDWTLPEIEKHIQHIEKRKKTVRAMKNIGL